MRTYCLPCRKHTNNVGSWNTTMTNQNVVLICLINQDL